MISVELPSQRLTVQDLQHADWLKLFAHCTGLLNETCLQIVVDSRMRLRQVGGVASLVHGC